MVVFGAKMLVYASVLKTVEAELVCCKVPDAFIVYESTQVIMKDLSPQMTTHPRVVNYYM